MPQSFDAIIIGAGVAGLYTALCLNPSLRVLILTKGTMNRSNSARAQGGIAAVLDNSRDSQSAHLNDSLVAGGFKNNSRALKILVSSAPAVVQSLMDCGVNFDRKQDGSLDLSLEGGHTNPRVLHCKDATGWEIIRCLWESIQKRSNISIWENSAAVDIRPIKNGFGLEILRQDIPTAVSSNCCIIATGGIGRVFEYTSNSAVATGDGILLAEQIGAKLRHMDWIQFHPTAFADMNRECFLMSETMRGDGARLLNAEKQPFLSRYDERAELAPRDVVCRAMLAEGGRLHDPHFYLDFMDVSPEYAEARYPNISAKLRSEGLELTRDPIPVYPCQHYLMGGIDTGLNGESSVRGLYAVGECAHSGVHGNNRLAGNSMLEDLVFARQIADDINKKAGSLGSPAVFSLPERKNEKTMPTGLRTKIREIMQKSCFILPDMTAVVDGFEQICAIRNLVDRENFILSRPYLETRALAHVAYAILKEIL